MTTAVEVEQTTTTATPRGVHHHADVEAADYQIAVGLGLDLAGLCGATGPAHPDPLALPCCPTCAAHLAAPCSGAST